MKNFMPVIIIIAGMLSGCSAFAPPERQQTQAGSVMEYLYPKATDQDHVVPATTTRIRIPAKVGIAFVPAGRYTYIGLPEEERAKMLNRIKDAFSNYKFISKIEIIPTAYLRAGGGFANLEQVARLYDVDVMALLSYDQVQFTDSNRLSLLYLTVIGAYVINGDEYDTRTLLDTAVFDVKSHKLLFRAPGTSTVKGSAAMVKLTEQAREARIEGFNLALEDMIPALKKELEAFKERVKNEPTITVEKSPGYSGGGNLGWVGIVLGLIIFGVKRARKS